MQTLVGTGASRKHDTKTAAIEATQAALPRLRNIKASYGLVFAGPGHDLRVALGAVREASGSSEIIASTTAGEITEAGLIHDGLVVMLVASDTSTFNVSFATGLKADHRGVAAKLVKAAADAKRIASTKNHKHLTTVLLTDGLAGTGEDLVLELHERANSVAQIVGGAAGDEARFHETRVGARTDAAPDAAAALHVFGPTQWGIGVNHGLRSTTKQMRVSSARGNVIYQIEGAPAFEVYKRHANERGVALNPATAGPYMIANELGIHFFDKINRARAPLSVGPDGSLRCAAAIPEGAMVSILDGEPSSMVDAARSAALEAQQHLGDAKPAGVLLFDCVCRGMILKDGFQKEIDAIRSVFGDVPVAGFLTYGEIARYRGRLDGWHNTTAVVAAIPA